MLPYPHHYKVTSHSAAAGNLQSTAAGVPELVTASPAEFDGPGDQWSPETLLCAAVANCLILTFRAVARASKFEWQALECETTGTLERIDGVTRFTHFVTKAILTAPTGTDSARAQLLLEKAERSCLVARSLNADSNLQVELRQS
jgi:organic hydroperoxide reductase OsmC/OhrA